MIHYPAAVHASAVVDSECRQRVAVEGIWIDHLSHPDVAAYLKKTNRYTSQPNRSGPPAERITARSTTFFSSRTLPGQS